MDFLIQLHVSVHTYGVPIPVYIHAHTFLWWGHSQTEIELSQSTVTWPPASIGDSCRLQIVVGSGVTKGKSSQPWLHIRTTWKLLTYASAWAHSKESMVWVEIQASVFFFKALVLILLFS